MSSTPNSKGIEKPLRKEPKGGWKESTYYVCNVAFSSHNVIHRAMFFTGFLNGKNGNPGGYNGFVCRAGYEDGAPKYTDAFYVEPLYELMNEKMNFIGAVVDSVEP